MEEVTRENANLLVKIGLLDLLGGELLEEKVKTFECVWNVLGKKQEAILKMKYKNEFTLTTADGGLSVDFHLKTIMPEKAKLQFIPRIFNRKKERILLEPFPIRIILKDKAGEYDRKIVLSNSGGFQSLKITLSKSMFEKYNFTALNMHSENSIDSMALISSNKNKDNFLSKFDSVVAGEEFDKIKDSAITQEFAKVATGFYPNVESIQYSGPLFFVNQSKEDLKNSKGTVNIGKDDFVQ